MKRILKNLFFLQPKHRFSGFDIPVDLLQMTGAGPESFEAISANHIDHLRNTVGIKPDHHILEVGCGIGRDAIPLTRILSRDGKYLGIDIIRRSIEWCQKNITLKHPNFRFVHFDVRDQLHNPKGSIPAMKDIRLPVADKSVDRIILWSVFTHMFRDDILSYLGEFKRVLAPEGKVFATCYVVDEKIIASAQQTNLTPYDIRFEYQLPDGCFINDLKHPAGSVGYEETDLRSLIEKSGLKIERIQRGSWSGFFEKRDGPGQDAVVLTL